ncbi:nitrite reductase small subunit NirD [Sessilibacter corallicola]|uniref:Nitrite reductase small subunit NirD n=1 Tax=Sessilibacter corallicola TaxID=2904075 RepID=A0ABQ0A7K4_9GAMM|nr:nitrite reductase small subunit NirD [Sessilibacter corallicola]
MSEKWVAVCQDQDLIPGTGLCALVEGEQVAVFKIRKDSQLFAVSNYDPIGDANVLARGMTGSIGESIVVASPLYKQHFDLQTGQCVEDSEVSIKTFSVRKNGESIEIKAS